MNLTKTEIKKNHKKNGFRYKRKTVVLFILLLMFTFLASAQSRGELEKQRIQLQEEIMETKDLLFKSQKREKNLLSELNDLNSLIQVRTKLINTIQAETEELSKEIVENEGAVELLQARLEQLKQDYAKMVVQSYKRKAQQSRLMFLLSSENFLQAYKRIEYINQYANYRAKQGEEIKIETLKLENLIDYLKETKITKQELLVINKLEKDSINEEKIAQEQLVKSVKKNEKKYITQINQKQKQERAISKKIELLIRNAIANSNKKSNVKSTGFALTPEAKELEKDFISNKGKLPSPVERGIIVRRYGKQSHPTLKGITIESNGLFYATEKDANARVIFDGRVLAIQVLPGKKKAVLVQHGNYISVYKNLDNVSVQKGDIVRTKQEIGKIHTDKTTGKTILAFVLFKEIHRQNPEDWVYKI